MNKMYYAPHNAKMNRVSGHGDAIAQRDVPCVIIGLSSRLSPFSFMGPASEMVICLPLFAIASSASYSFFPLFQATTFNNCHFVLCCNTDTTCVVHSFLGG